MTNKRNDPNIKDERIEDTTLYGEFVSSFDQWMTSDRQKAIAEHLEVVTEVNANKNKAAKNDKNRTK